MSWPCCGISTEEHGRGEVWADCSLEAMNCAGLDETELEHEHNALHKASNYHLKNPHHHHEHHHLHDGHAAKGAPRGGVAPAPGVPIHVPEQYLLQEAVQLGQEHGNPIVISSGNHRLKHDVVIDGNVRIVGESGTTIHGSLLCVEGSSGMLSGLKIEAGSSDQEENGAVVIKAGVWTVRDCVLSTAGGGNDALRIAGDAKVTLQGCALGCNGGTNSFEKFRGATLWVSGFAAVKASECTMLGMGRGVFVHGCSNAEFKFCTFSDNSEAVVVGDRTVAIVKRCSFVRNAKASFAVAPDSNKNPQRSTLIASDNKFDKSPEWGSQARPWKVLNSALEDDDAMLVPTPSTESDGRQRGSSRENRRAQHGSHGSVGSQHGSFGSR